MGRTVSTYRMELKFEIAKWKDFRKNLRTIEEKEAFDELMDMCRSNAMTAGSA